MIKQLTIYISCIMLVWAGCSISIVFAEPDIVQSFNPNKTGTPMSKARFPDCDDAGHIMDKFCFDPSVQEVINR